jgi:stage II sporulation protein AA (anti-sigma F factor antagonist)
LAHVIIVPPDEIDPTTSDGFGADLAGAAMGDDIVVEFAGVTFCDSSGIRELVVAYKRQSEGGGSLQVVNASDRVRRVFDIAGITDRLLAPPAPM